MAAAMRSQNPNSFNPLKFFLKFFPEVGRIASFLQENRAKCSETMQNDRNIRIFSEIHAKMNDIYEIRRVFDAFCEIPLQILSYSAKKQPFFW